MAFWLSIESAIVKFRQQALVAQPRCFSWELSPFCRKLRPAILHAQIVQHFIYKPKPTELLLKPQAEKPKPNKPVKDAKN